MTRRNLAARQFLSPAPRILGGVVVSVGLILVAAGTAVSFVGWVNTDETVTWKFDRSADIVAELVMGDGATLSQWCGFITPLQAVEFYVEVKGGQPPNPTCSEGFPGITYWAGKTPDQLSPPDGAVLIARFPEAEWDLYRLQPRTLEIPGN